MTLHMPSATHLASDPRLQQIALARQAVLQDGISNPRAGMQAWIERSWQRCLASGKRPEQKVTFDMVLPATIKRLLEANRAFVQTARPVLQSLSRAIATTRYFAVLTDAHGVVIDAHGAIDRRDPRADLITRIGTAICLNASWPPPPSALP